MCPGAETATQRRRCRARGSPERRGHPEVAPRVSARTTARRTAVLRAVWEVPHQCQRDLRRLQISLRAQRRSPDRRYRRGPRTSGVDQGHARAMRPATPGDGASRATRRSRCTGTARRQPRPNTTGSPGTGARMISTSRSSWSTSAIRASSVAAEAWTLLSLPNATHKPAQPSRSSVRIIESQYRLARVPGGTRDQHRRGSTRPAHTAGTCAIEWRSRVD